MGRVFLRLHLGTRAKSSGADSYLAGRDVLSFMFHAVTR